MALIGQIIHDSQSRALPPPLSPVSSPNSTQRMFLEDHFVLIVERESKLKTLFQ